MGYRLGVDLGTSFTAATIGRAGTAQGGSLGVDSAIVPSLVYIGADGEREYGKAAAERAGAEPHRVLRGFARRIGDETPMLPEAGPVTAAHRVAADLVAWVVAQASVQEGREPDAVAVTHPATWGPHKRDLFLAALREAGVPGASLVAEPVGAALTGAEGREHAPGAVVAVYDLGGRTFDAALVRREADGAWTVLGSPAGLPDLGGTDLDDLVLAHVLGGLSPEQQEALGRLDPEDEATTTAMAGLRAACVKAKEALSSQTTTAVAVTLPGITANVRLTRAEFEGMITASIEATVDVLDAVVTSAGLVAGDLDCILITGGSSRIPLVTQLLSRQFHVPVVTAGGANSATAIAAGAVLALAHTSTTAQQPAPAPAKPAAKRSAKRLKAAAKPATPVPSAAPPAVPVQPVAVPPVAVQPLAVPAPATPAVPVAAAVAQPVAQPVTQPTAEPVAEAPAVDRPLPAPSGPSSKPIRSRRGARRAEVVGLEGLATAVRADDAPIVDGPRAVVPARKVASVDVLLAEEPVRSAPAPTAVREETVRLDEMLPPPRPALDDAVFSAIEVDEVDEVVAGWTWRSLFSVRRSLALTVLTGAIYVGSTAWIPATPAITDQGSSASLKVASVKHGHR
jgi:hypothetical protein